MAAFNELFDEDLPEPVARNAALFLGAPDEDAILGRCVCIGAIPQLGRFYHWAVRLGEDGRPAVEDF